jgi:Peptidase M10 serralysin C terminal/FG-GAP-like repeat/Metallo-peptidase family M12B Reprolysin-like
MPIAPPSIDLNTAIATLRTQFFWGAGSITFSIPTAGSSWPGYSAGTEPFDASYSTLSASLAAQFRLAIQRWDDLIARSFVEVAEPAGRGDIRVALTTMTGTSAGAWGYANFPPYQGGASSPVPGDIWISSGVASGTFAPGTYDFQATMHELGHTLGLEHPFEASPPLTAQYDNYRYSIMSYTAPADSTLLVFSSTSGGGIQYVTRNVSFVTPALFDIAAVQSVYGADPTTRVGNSVYTWSQSVAQFEVVYDAGGVDSFDLSGHTRPSNLDLRPGAFSSVDIYSKAAQIEAAVAQFGEGFRNFITNSINTRGTFTWENNVGIAYGTIIENALLGSGNDTAIGNDADNVLTGNAGNDTLDGGKGIDTARYSGLRANYTITRNAGGTVTVADARGGSPEGSDTLAKMEWAQFSNTRVWIGGQKKQDLNNDATSDVLLRNGAGIIANWVIANGSITGGGAIANTPGYSIAGTGDFNGDGTSDMLLVDGVGVVTNIGFANGAISGAATVSGTSGFGVVGTGDFNGDGTSDVLLENAAGVIAEWIFGNGVITGGSAIANAPGYTVAATGDFNGDGTSDFLLANAAGVVTNITMQNGTITNFAAIGSLQGFSIAGTGDFNGDGTSDILLQNAGGVVAEWLMGNGVITGGGAIANAPGYTVVATGDYNGDGTSDFLLNNGAGIITNLFMQNGAISGSSLLGSTSGFSVQA